MLNSSFVVPKAVNEPVRNYEPNSKEVKSLLATYKEMFNEVSENSPIHQWKGG